MNTIVEKITELIKEMLQGWVMSNLEGMFTDVNTKVGTIAGEVSQTPSAWNASVFTMIQTLSDTVIIPIAGIIITYVLCYELITMVMSGFMSFGIYFQKRMSQRGINQEFMTFVIPSVFTV